MPKRPVLLLGLALSLLSVHAYAEIYLKFGGITGEVSYVEYQDWIELESVGFDVERAYDMGNPINPQAAKALLGKIVGQKEFTPSSPLLFSATASGTVDPAAEIHFVTIDADTPIPYYKVNLTDALISRFSQTAPAVSFPNEALTLAYKGIEFRSSKNPGGPSSSDVTATWDLITSKGSGTGGTPVNAPPTISSIANQSTVEDITRLINFSVSDVRTPADYLQFTTTSSNTSLVPNPRVEGTGGNRILRLNPANNQFGTTDITVTVSDGSLSASTAFTLTVTPQNDTPFIYPISSLSFVRSTPITGIVAWDVDAGTNTLSLAASVTQGTIFTNSVVPELTVQNNGFSAVTVEASLATLNSLSSSSSLIYQSYPNFNGTDTMALVLTDDQGAASVQQDITLNVFATAYDQWLETNFSADLGTPASEATRWGEQADPDDDGIPNLVEYALGLNPDLPDAGQAPDLVEVMANGKRYYSITIDRINDPDVTVQIEVCDDLVGNIWSSATSEIEITNVTQGPQTHQITFQDKKAIEDTAIRFYRIAATRAP